SNRRGRFLFSFVSLMKSVIIFWRTFGSKSGFSILILKLPYETGVADSLRCESSSTFNRQQIRQRRALSGNTRVFLFIFQFTIYKSYSQYFYDLIILFMICSIIFMI